LVKLDEVRRALAAEDCEEVAEDSFEVLTAEGVGGELREVAEEAVDGEGDNLVAKLNAHKI
jgi:hypothetical protein